MKAVCENCKHWDRDAPPERRHDTLVDVDTCEYKEEPHRVCLRIAFVSYNVRPAPDAPFMTDAEGRGATLWTPADFFCAGFEAR